MTRMNIFAASLVVLGICCRFAFAESTPSPGAGTGLEGLIVISPSHPGPIREGMANTAPLVNYAFIVRKADEIVASFTTDEKGAFRISLPPGHYTVTQKNPASKVGRFGPFEVDLVEGQVTKVNWTCDSGMR